MFCQEILEILIKNTPLVRGVVLENLGGDNNREIVVCGGVGGGVSLEKVTPESVESADDVVIMVGKVGRDVVVEKGIEVVDVNDKGGGADDVFVYEVASFEDNFAIYIGDGDPMDTVGSIASIANFIAESNLIVLVYA